MNLIQRQEISRYLEAFDFSGLFSDPAIGWDWPDSRSHLRIPFEGVFLSLDVVAEKRGVKVIVVPPRSDGSLWPSDARKALDRVVTPMAQEHLLIFVDQAKHQQVWLWTSRLKGKPTRYRELHWERGRSNELLLQRIASIAFTLDEEEALDISGVVRRLHDSLDRDKLTKKFYDEFKKQKDRFQSFISGLSDEGMLAHYTSLMLNRLMFCYFLQQKGFLNGEQDYLKRRLQSVRETLGEDRFHSFYRTFLKRLFHEGFDADAAHRSQELVDLIGPNIPYLNGGIFAEHAIEREHPDLEIPDSAFEKVFAFFDQWNWHLDDRPLGDDREINPEVLGYVFEKYTNQKQMGAYYTKEDITEYICKNTLIPYLLDKVQHKLPSSSWDLLRKDPDRYLYEAVRHGALDSRQAWEASLPGDIRCGLRPSTLEQMVTSARPIQTLELRKHWNTPTPPSHGLPTEIWRETIARHERCHSLRDQLRSGAVTSSADLITSNLNIRQFFQDLVADAAPELTLALWKELSSLSVLDPTCGSGAFLFAALEILEPIYEGLLQRMRDHLCDWRSLGESHPRWQEAFERILQAVERHPNEGYYIHKCIIVHNLYGVDIMEEAVEICKLRLFLKLASQLEPGQNIEPLPDIDFNVRCGNTLVGYATYDEVKRAIDQDSKGQALMQFDDTMAQLETRVADLQQAFDAFRQQQSEGEGGVPLSHKQDLQRRLADLEAVLNRYLAKEYGIDPDNNKAFARWKQSHQPFHWFIEFYGILNRGGFDVIVGNPPYLETRDVGYGFKNYVCFESGAIHAMCIERSDHLLDRNGCMSMIVPLSLPSTQRMQLVQEMLERNRNAWFANYSWRPGKLFDTVNRALTIFTVGVSTSFQTCSTNYQKWTSESRCGLLERLNYVAVPRQRSACWIPKVGDALEQQILQKCLNIKTVLKHFVSRSEHRVYYRTTGGLYWKVFTDFPPAFNLNGEKSHSSRETWFTMQNREYVRPTIAALSSDVFWWWYTATSNVRDLNPFDVQNFPLPESVLADPVLQELGASYLQDLNCNSSMVVRKQKQTGTTETQSFKIQKSKPIIDEIDMILAEHYGFTEEELDFIINYDIKYRMGKSIGAEDEE